MLIVIHYRNVLYILKLTIHKHQIHDRIIKNKKEKRKAQDTYVDGHNDFLFL